MENKIVFNKSSVDNRDYLELRRRIKRAIKMLPNSRILIKPILAFALPLLYLLLYFAALSSIANPMLFVTLYGLMGVLSVIIFISLIHDCVHNNVFRKAINNKRFLIVFDLMGGNSFVWKKRHLLMHHNYQNIAGWDSDIEQAGLLKIFPQDKLNKINKYQHIWIFLLYPLFLFNWIFIRDFKDFFSKRRLIRKVFILPKMEYVKLFVFKFLFLFYILIVPMLIGASLWLSFWALSILLITGSVCAMVSLLTPHVNSKNEFPIPNESGELNISWFQHQFLTTNDIRLNNWFSRNIMGNFNFHLAHHLFPTVSSVYAPEVTAVIRDFAKEKDIEYRAYGFFESLGYHYDLVKANALDINVFEEDM